MDNSIIVSVSELRSRIQDIRRSGMDFVELSIQPSEIVDGDLIPTILEFSASKRADTSMWVEFEEIEAPEDEQKLKEISLTALHMSDNLM